MKALCISKVLFPFWMPFIFNTLFWNLLKNIHAAEYHILRKVGSPEPPMVSPCLSTPGQHNRSAFGMRLCSSICLLEKQLHSWHADQSAKKEPSPMEWQCSTTWLKGLRHSRGEGQHRCASLQPANLERGCQEDNTLLWIFQIWLKRNARTQCTGLSTAAQVRQGLGYWSE